MIEKTKKRAYAAKKKAAAQKRACDCIHYEDGGEDYAPCEVCGHAPEEHSGAGCVGEVRP